MLMDYEIVLHTFSNPSIFQSPISNVGLDFGFSNSPRIPPNCPKLIQLPIFYLVNYYGGNWKIQKSPNSPKISPFSIPSQKSIFKVQELSNLKGTKPDRTVITVLDNNGIFKLVNS
jgi:hypothetical protein